MIKKLTLVFALSFLFLTACADTNVESAPPSNISEEAPSETIDNASQTFELSTETDPADANTYETLTETDEPVAIRYSPIPQLLYRGEIYLYIVGSDVTEVDGKYYELWPDEILEPFIDAERMKEECEYIGKSIPISIDLTPEHELELASYSDEPCELYKIDENQILVCYTVDYEISEERFKQTMFYPGTYRSYLIVVKNADGNAQANLIAKYYRYKERFPETYRNWVEIYGITTEA